MKINKTLDKGKRLFLPYKEGMEITIASDMMEDFNIENLSNNRTGQYASSFNITKYLSKNQLMIRSVKPDSPRLKIIYKNNGIKGDMIIDDELIEINLDDTLMTLKTDENYVTVIEIESSDVLINEEMIQQEQHQQKSLKTENQSLKQQFDELKKENERLSDENESLKKQSESLVQKNTALSRQIEEYENDIHNIEVMMSDKNDQSSLLKKQLEATLHYYEITYDIFKEYQNENDTSDMEKILKEVKDNIRKVEEMLKKRIEAKQRQVDKIRKEIKP